MVTANPPPTPTANPYAPIKVTPVVHTSTGTTSMPAPVSTTTGASVITANQNAKALHNQIVQQQLSRRVSGTGLTSAA